MRRALLLLPNGKTFTISAGNLDDTHPFVGSVSLNGKPLNRVWIGHDEIMAGGELHFTMSTQPNKTRGTSAAARPYSISAYP
ncbi:MAG: hypothetical protein C4338_03245 [Rhodanobacteraceae bacterium]